MKVLVVTEDPTHDRHILKPILARIFDDLGVSASIYMHEAVGPRGRSAILQRDRLVEVFEENPMIGLFVIVADRDCRGEGEEIEGLLDGVHITTPTVSCWAIEEIEVWMLAGIPGFNHRWSDVRSECHPKEVYVDPFLSEKGWADQVGRGYKRAMREVPGNWNRVFARCSELDSLRATIGALLSNGD